MQHSIFEPLYCLQAPTMEAPSKQLALIASQAAPSLFSISPPSPSSFLLPIHREHPPFSFDQDISSSLQHAYIITPSSSIPTYKKARSEQDLTSDSTHLTLPLPHSILSPTVPSPCSIIANSSHSKLPGSVCSNNAAHDRNCDDGSIASKLFSSMITKSISSPSLQLTNCKEAARETSYQKTLKLKHMKLQHCAEALGMESSDNSSFLYDSQCIHQEKIDMIDNPLSFTPSCTLSNSHQESSLKSVKSSPNLSSASPLMTNHSRYTRSTSFPPPLSHTLPTSSSHDSLSISLRAYRENGRFILKETMAPSKHYFQANRRNGRLTLHVFTREEEEEEHFAGQADDHEELSYREAQKENLSEVEEEGIPMCMYEGTPGKSFDNKVEDSNDTNQALNEEVCVKESLGMHNSKEINVASSHLDMSLQRLNCIANHNNNNGSEDDDKRQVISNVITLSLQTSSHSKVTLHKAQVLSFPLISSPLKQSAFIHSTGRSQGCNHDMSTFPQSKENFIWESNLMPCALATSSSRRIQRKGGGGSGGGCGGGGVAAPAFLMEENGAKSLLMKAVSELATSLVLEASYASGDWWLAGKKKPLLSEVESGESGTIIGGYASDIDNAIIMDGKIIGNDGLTSQGANFGYNTTYFSEEEKASNTSHHEGGKELDITTSPLNLDSQFSSSSNANLQYEEWLHTLHCKELFDRHKLSQGLMKPHCIPTRS